MLKSSKNYYEILGVTPDVESGELKSVYRRLVRKFHPDVNPDGERRFKDILEAYETLCDDRKRSCYDTLNGFFKTSGTSGNKSEPYRKSYRTSDGASDAIKKDTFEKSARKEKNIPDEPKKEPVPEKDFTDIINDIIDGFSQKAKKPKKQKEEIRKPEKGEDIYADVSITLKESVSGTHKIVNVVHTDVCTHCCGRKFINDSKCPHCGGRGKITSSQRINVTIPPHIKDGAKLRLSGEGKKGKNGGKNGDLYLKITVEPDSSFKIDGIDLKCEVAVSPFEAVLGGDIEIPSLTGTVTLNLPPCTKSGQTFRISSGGLKKNNLVGDIIITVKIQIPEKLSEEELKLYEKLKDISGQSVRENLVND